MTITRIYQNLALAIDQMVELDEKASHHLIQVMRLRMGEKLIIFNGEGGEYQAEIMQITKKRTRVRIAEYVPNNTESTLKVHLLQAIPRGEKMDFILQKAIELGVDEITPLFTQRCNVKLPADRFQKRIQHWQGVITSACEQSGRSYVPNLNKPKTLSELLAKTTNEYGLILNPRAAQALNHLSPPTNNKVRLLIGPEGGLEANEISLAEQHGFQGLRLGPRILRTETAPLAIITALQCKWGDLGL